MKLDHWALWRITASKGCFSALQLAFVSLLRLKSFDVKVFNSYRCKGLQSNSSLFSSCWLLHAANCLLSCTTALIWLTCLMILRDHLLRPSTSSFKSLFVKRFHCQLCVILWHALAGWKPPYTVLSSQESQTIDIQYLWRPGTTTKNVKPWWGMVRAH